MIDYDIVLILVPCPISLHVFNVELFVLFSLCVSIFRSILYYELSIKTQRNILTTNTRNFRLFKIPSEQQVGCASYLKSFLFQ